LVICFRKRSLVLTVLAPIATISFCSGVQNKRFSEKRETAPDGKTRTGMLFGNRAKVNKKLGINYLHINENKVFLLNLKI